jgi:hypothetical protein
MGTAQYDRLPPTHDYMVTVVHLGDMETSRSADVQTHMIKFVALTPPHLRFMYLVTYSDDT